MASEKSLSLRALILEADMARHTGPRGYCEGFVLLLAAIASGLQSAPPAPFATEVHLSIAPLD